MTKIEKALEHLDRLRNPLEAGVGVLDLNDCPLSDRELASITSTFLTNYDRRDIRFQEGRQGNPDWVWVLSKPIYYIDEQHPYPPLEVLYYDAIQFFANLGYLVIRPKMEKSEYLKTAIEEPSPGQVAFFALASLGAKPHKWKPMLEDLARQDVERFNSGQPLLTMRELPVPDDFPRHFILFKFAFEQFLFHEQDKFFSEYCAYVADYLATMPLAPKPNKLPEIPAHPLKERRESVRALKLQGMARKDIAKKIKEPEDTVKKDLEWLRVRHLLPQVKV